MPLRTSEAFIIDVIRLKEADRLVILFTEDEGKVRGVAASAARSRRRFGGKLERLSRVRATWFDREGRDLARLDTCDLLDASFTLYADLRAAALLAYVAEMVNTFVREREPEPRYFRLVRSVIEAVRGGADPESLARYFEIWTLRLHGLMPSLDACSECGSSLREGAFIQAQDAAETRCGKCRSARPGGDVVKLSADTLQTLERFRRLAPLEAARERAGSRALREIEDLAGAVLASFVGQPFRSTRFLKEALRQVPGA